MIQPYFLLQTLFSVSITYSFLVSSLQQEFEMMAVERKTQGVGKKARVGAVGSKTQARVGAVGSKTEGVGKRVRVNWNVPYWKAFLIAIRGPNGKKKKKAAEIKYLARLKQQLSDKKNGLLPEVYIGYPKPKMMSRLSYRE